MELGIVKNGKTGPGPGPGPVAVRKSGFLIQSLLRLLLIVSLVAPPTSTSTSTIGSNSSKAPSLNGGVVAVAGSGTGTGTGAYHWPYQFLSPVKRKSDNQKSLSKINDPDSDIDWLLPDEKYNIDDKQDFNTFVSNINTGATINGLKTSTNVVNATMRTLGAIAAFVVFIIKPIFDGVLTAIIFSANGIGRRTTSDGSGPGSGSSSNYGGITKPGKPYPDSHSSYSFLSKSLKYLEREINKMSHKSKKVGGGGGDAGVGAFMGGRAGRDSKFKSIFSPAAGAVAGTGTGRGILDADRCIERISCNVIDLTNGRSFILDFAKDRYSDGEQRPGQITKRILRTIARQGGNCAQYNCDPVSFVFRLFIYIMDWNTLFKA